MKTSEENAEPFDIIQMAVAGSAKELSMGHVAIVTEMILEGLHYAGLTISTPSDRPGELEKIIDGIHGALCNYINGCSDPYTPVSQWDEESERAFVGLAKAYNDWYSANPDIRKIALARYASLSNEEG